MIRIIRYGFREIMEVRIASGGLPTMFIKKPMGRRRRVYLTILPFQYMNCHQVARIVESFNPGVVALRQSSTNAMDRGVTVLFLLDGQQVVGI